MKVFFFLNILAPYRIGLYNKLDNKLEGDVKFFFDSYSEKNRKWNSFYDSIRFKYEIFNSPKLHISKRSSSNIESFHTIYFPFGVLKTCLSGKPDTIISLEMGLRSIFCIIYSKIYKKKIYILSEITDQSEADISALKKIIRKLIIKNINGGIAHGILSFNYFLKLGLPKDKIIISPDAVDNDFFISESKKYNKNEIRQNLKIDFDTFVFLYVGQLIYRKGIDILFSAMQELKRRKKQRKIVVLIVGGKQAELKDIIENYDGSLFRFSDFKQIDQLIPYYVVSDCLIFPTRQDVWGMVINESIACGLPVAVSKYAGGSVDLIENEKSGYIFDPLDINSFIGTLEKCLNNQYKLKLFAERAKEKLKIYNHENATNTIVNFIK